MKMEYNLQVSSLPSSSTATATPRSRSVSFASQGSLNNLVAGHSTTDSSSTTNHHPAPEAGTKAKLEKGGGSKPKMEKGHQDNSNTNNAMLVVSDGSDTETTTPKVAKAVGTAGATTTPTGGPTTGKASTTASTTTTSTTTSSSKVVVVVPSSPTRSPFRRRSKSKTCRRVSDFTDDGITNTTGTTSADGSSSNGNSNDSNTTQTAATATPTKKRKSRSCRGGRSKTGSNSHPINHRAKHYVEHNYHDHKRDPIVVPNQLTVLQGAGGATTAAIEATAKVLKQGQQHKGNRKDQQEHQPHHHHKGGVTTPFPERLHQLLEAVDDEDLMDIVGWQPHGRCFIVHKPKDFVDSVMPRFFKQSKLTSFQRQLNLYGFCRLTTGQDRGGYYHELFIRGRVDLCNRMVRTRIKGNGSKAASSPATEPNFYKMEFCRRPDESDSCSGSGSTTDTEMSQMVEEEATPISPTMSTDDLVNAVIDEDYPFEDCKNEFDDDDEKSAGRKTPPSILPEAICSDDIGMSLSESTPMLLDDTFGPLDRESTESSLDLKTIGSVPFVSPLVPSTRNVLDGSKFEMADAPTLDPFDSFFEPQEPFHSGEQLSFMGLPFHYLKSEDVIECLHQS